MNFFYVSGLPSMYKSTGQLLNSIDAASKRKLIMRINVTMILMTIFLLKVSASDSFAQQITLNRKNASLKEVFAEIKKQTGYSVLYKSAVVRNSKPVTIVLSNVQIEEAMPKILKGQNLDFAIDDKSIVIKEKEKSIPNRIRDFFPKAEVNVEPQQNEIRGRVTDSLGNALQGASIKVKGYPISSSTNRSGEFILRNVPEGATLVVSSMGFVTQELSVSANLSTIRLVVSSSPLDEVQIVGYGTTTKRFNTGNVTTIKAEDIQHSQHVSVVQALQGMVPGLFIQQSNGNAGASSKVMLRGVNSITSGTTPLYIIDGVPFDGNPTDRQGSSYLANLANGTTDPLNAINPADIESIDVLKDADATSIYGARGANGVIIITTKNAKLGKLRVDGKVFSSVGKAVKLLSTLSTEEFVALRRQAFANDNITPTTANAPDLTLWDQTGGTDYQELLLGNTQSSTDANLSLSQGNELSGFMFSAAYHDESSILLGDLGYTRGSIRGRGYLNSANKKFKLDFSTIYTEDKNRLPTGDFTGTALTLPQNYPLYNTDGSLYFVNSYTNPIAYLRRQYTTRVKHIMFNTTVSYSILNNLKFKTNLGFDNIDQLTTNLVPLSSVNPATVIANNAQATYTSNATTTYILEPQFDYQEKIGKGKLAATLGGTYQYRKNDQPYYILATGFSSDALLGSLSAATNILSRGSYSYLYKYTSLFGRLNYIWDEKYIASGTFRRDGSSRFGPGKQFGNFASMAAAWIFTEEDFLKNKYWLSFGKLRASYGSVGNDQITAFGYLDTYGPTAIAYGSNSTLQPSSIANPEFSWETTKKLEFALELGLFKNNLMVNVSWYRNRSSDLLANYPLSGQTGFTSYLANIDAVVENKGLELEIKTTPISTDNVKWNVGFNISGARNRLISFPNLAGSTYASTYAIGQPLNVMALYNLVGFEDGVAQYEDVNGDGNITAGLNGTGDQLPMGTRDPKYYGGLISNLTYKNFQLDMLINFTKQLGYQMVSFPGLATSIYSDLLNSNFTPSASTTSASYTSYLNRYPRSSAIIDDASYLRLRNITLSYNLPGNWLKAIKSSSCRVFLTGQNLFTITNYNGYDPETQVRYNTLNVFEVAPPLRAYSAGIQFSF